MSEVTGKKVQRFPIQSNASQIGAMRAGRLHLAGLALSADRDPYAPP